jgi:hypothetical protein
MDSSSASATVSEYECNVSLASGRPPCWQVVHSSSEYPGISRAPGRFGYCCLDSRKIMISLDCTPGTT